MKLNFLWVIQMFSMLLIRIVDIFLSSFLIVILSPLFFIISVLIIILDGSPIFYISLRVGKKGEMFKIYKFRTMKIKKNNNDKDEITHIGKYLRRLSFDEIPQFINILKNEMSFVGPRPLPIEIEKEIPSELIKIRRLVKPGITGYAQIMYNRKRRDWLEKSKQDIQYIKKISFLRYLSILFLTFPTLIKRFRFNNKGGTL